MRQFQSRRRGRAVSRDPVRAPDAALAWLEPELFGPDPDVLFNNDNNLWAWSYVRRMKIVSTIGVSEAHAMPSDKQQQSLSEKWSERFDDRDDEELAWHIWAQKLAQRDQAMANPIKPFDLPEDDEPGRERPMAASDSKPA